MLETLSKDLADLANNAMHELHMTYPESATYVLRTHPELARAYRDSTLTPGFDHHLSNVAINYQPPGFIADRILPVVQVPRSGKVPGAEYYCVKYALKADVTLEDRTFKDPLFVQQFEEGRVHRVQDALFLDWEMRAATAMFQAQDRNVFHALIPWTDYTNSNPLEDIEQASVRIKLATGYRPNRILFSGTAWRHFRRNRAVVDKATNPHVSGGGLYPSARQVEDLLELQVLVGNAWHNAAQEALALDLTQIWQDHVLVYYAPEQPSIETPSFGYYFRWAAPGLPSIQVERLPYDSRRHCNEIEIGYCQDEVILRPDLGCRITGVVTG